MKLGSELRRLRKERRLKLIEVSDEAKLSVSFLSDVERGRTNPSLDTLEKLAAFYQVSINDILKETDFGVAPSKKSYPSGFEEFLKEVGGSVDNQMEDLLLRAENRSKRKAQTKEDWLKLYYSLSAILGE
jgi:XRE family transcriptional regulator, regulator of sulfur utilization